MTKYQRVESAEVLSPEEHARLENGLHRIGKVALKDASEDEKQKVLKESKRAATIK